METRVHLYFGDNLIVCESLLKEFGDAFTLIYLDPPFFTQKSFCGFDDHWKDLKEYVSYLRERVLLFHRLVAPHGSMVIHVDSRVSHYVKVMVDEIFGYDTFASEIIWRYRRWPTKTKNFQRIHDTLLRWVRDSKTDPRFVQQYEPLAPSTLKTMGNFKQLAIFDSEGKRHFSLTQDSSPGVPLGDVWDIPILASQSKERTGYPTQKPEALLKLLIASLTFEDDLILDPYMGSGTTLTIGSSLNRRVIGIDSSSTAFEIVKQRFTNLKIPFSEQK
jgi:DNA modification methylase